MAVENIPHSHGMTHMARIVCDECCRSDVVACRYVGDTSRGNNRPDMGQVNKKAMGKGWSVAKGKLICPACTAKRKAAKAVPKWLKDAELIAETQQEKPTMTKTEAKPETASITSIRRPTPKQERLIILALEDAYDDQAKRYRGNNTDKTIADDLGDGVMFGWVAEVRERLFGPSGGNEEIEAIRAEIESVKRACEGKIKAATDELAVSIASLTKRIDAVCTAVGPRARSA